jgi:hypothetical protein
MRDRSGPPPGHKCPGYFEMKSLLKEAQSLRSRFESASAGFSFLA